jgi:hypothetical protein
MLVFAAPSSYRIALADDNWRAAMEDVFTAPHQNEMGSLVPKPPGQNIVSCKWVFQAE